MDVEILDTLEARKDTNCDYPWFIPDSSMIPADLSDPRKFMWFFFVEVIVERAAEARENDQEQKLKRKQQERVKSMEDANETAKMTEWHEIQKVHLEEIV